MPSVAACWLIWQVWLLPSPLLTSSSD